MRGFEKHRLTSRERKVVISVAVLMFIIFVLWMGLIVMVLPNPGHGTL